MPTLSTLSKTAKALWDYDTRGRRRACTEDQGAAHEEIECLAHPVSRVAPPRGMGDPYDCGSEFTASEVRFNISAVWRDGDWLQNGTFALRDRGFGNDSIRSRLHRLSNVVERAQREEFVLPPGAQGREAITGDFTFESMAVSLLTGGRPSEVAGLATTDISLDRDTVTFRPHAWRR